jgi:putative glutamine transport system substrate-binding protein
VRWLIFFFATAAYAGTPSEIRARGKLVVSVKNEGAAAPSAHHDPAHFQKRDFEVELARALAKKVLGDANKLELKLMPRAVRLFAVAEDRVDACISMISVDEDKQRQVDFSRPYWSNGLAVLVKTGTRIDKLQDLAGKHFVALRQTANDPSAELARKAKGISFTVGRVTSFEDAASLIEAKKAVGLITHAINIDAWVAKHPGFARSAILSREEFAIAVKKGNRELVTLANQTIDELEKSGELQKMQERAGLR